MQLQFNAEDLRPIIEEVLSQMIDRLPPAGDRLSYSEQEAARTLGVPRSALRDARLDGRIKPSAKIGKRYLYARKDLLKFLSLGAA